jgi:serine/threonine protein kinase
MQAICNGDYKFAPAEFWVGVSETARNFVRACLTVDPTNRPSAAELLNHPWLKLHVTPSVQDPTSTTGASVNLLPNVKKAFDAKKTCEFCNQVINVLPR